VVRLLTDRTFTDSITHRYGQITDIGIDDNSLCLSGATLGWLLTGKVSSCWTGPLLAWLWQRLESFAWSFFLRPLLAWLWQHFASFEGNSNLSKAFPAFLGPMSAWLWQHLTSFEGNSNLSKVPRRPSLSELCIEKMLSLKTSLNFGSL